MDEVKKCKNCFQDFVPDVAYDLSSMPVQLLSSKIRAIVFCCEKCKVQFHNALYYSKNSATVIAGVLARRIK